MAGGLFRTQFCENIFKKKTVFLTRFNFNCRAHPKFLFIWEYPGYGLHHQRCEELPEVLGFLKKMVLVSSCP